MREYDNGEDTIVSVFDQICFSFGDQDAIVTPDTAICYLEIQEYSKNLAHQLHWRFQPDYVLVDCQRFACAEAVATLACMRIQCPFVPVSCLDQHRPGRLNVVVDHLREKGKRNGAKEPHVVAITVCENDLDPILSVFQLADVHQIIYLDETGGIREQIQVPSHLPTLPQINDDLMVLFTSGTTGGSPKAVVGSHSATLRRIKWFHKHFESSSRVIRKTALTFIDGITELWCTLLDYNSVLVTIPPMKLQSEGLAAILLAEPTQLLLLPSQLGQLLLLPKCETLQRLIISGEQASRILVEEFFVRYPAVQLINLYGQTETTGDVLCAVLTDMDNATAFQGDVVAVGKPIADTKILVNNQQELVVEGSQLSNGYLDQQQRGEPFDSFATGDLGFCKNGIFYVRGRKDDVVKLHGIWTCPMEIETAFCQFYGAKEALVCFFQNESYLLCPDKDACLQFSREAMHAKGNFPWNLIPKRAICHEIPKSRSSGAGKASRKEARLLVEHHLQQPHSTDVGAYTLEPAQSTLSTIVCNTLNLREDQLDTQKSFVELGGNSAMAITLLFQLRQVFQRATTLTAFDILKDDSIFQLNQKLVEGDETPRKRQRAGSATHIEQPNYTPRSPVKHSDNHISIDLLACVDSQPVYHNGSIFAACQGGLIIKFTASGHVQAFRHLRGWMIQADLMIVKDCLIVCAYKRKLEDGGLVVGLSLDLKQEIWKHTLDLPVKTTPQVVDDSTLWVACGSTEKTHVCFLCTASGRPNREVLHLPVPSMSQPVVVDQSMIYGCSSWEGGLIVVDRSDGKVEHIFEGQVGPVIGRDLVALADGRVLVADSYSALHTIDLSKMTIETVQIGTLPLTTPVVHDDATIIVGSNDGSIYAISGSNILWKCHCGAAILATPMYRITDGCTVIGTTSGHIVGVNRQGTIVSNTRMIRGEIWGDSVEVASSSSTDDTLNREFVVFGARDARVHILALPTVWPPV